MSDADTAYELAREKIAEAARTGAEELDFSGEAFQALDRLPPTISELAGLQSLSLRGTRIFNITPLSGLKGLEYLDLNDTQITDLTPLAELKRLVGLYLANTNSTDVTPLSGLVALEGLRLANTAITDVAPLSNLTRLRFLWLYRAQISDLAPLSNLKELQLLELANTPTTDLAPLSNLKELRALSLKNTQIVDMRPITGLYKLGSDDLYGENLKVFILVDEYLDFRSTPATKRDATLAKLAQIKDSIDRTRQTLDYLRSLPPWPAPYTPAATPDGSPPQPIGGASIDMQAQALSDLTPLAEELVQSPETGRFSVRHKPIEKPDLLAATLGQVTDAIEDVLHDPSNGLNETSLDIRKLKRTLERYANDPQRIEMDFTTVHQSLTRQIALEGLPPSEENLALLTALEEGAQGIRATDAAVAVNRRILQEQKLRELSPEAVATVKAHAPIVQAITEGDLPEQTAEDVDYLTNVLPNMPPSLPGVTRDDAILHGRDEAVRFFGRSSRMLIMLRKSGGMIEKLHQSTIYKAAEIIQALVEIVKVGLSVFPL
ncbi:MAG: leucine-rich repeat domain-containing protein [Natronohydrobacter sp.]|nr:leucine-rich repeat domain-containing protein [Natronohydrobacter sp.]